MKKNFIDIIDDNEIDCLKDESKKIEEVSLTFDDVKRVIEFLKTENFYDGILQFYKIEDLEVLLEKTVERLSQNKK